MPEEEETRGKRGADEPAQPDDSRDRLFTQFCEVTEFKQILSSFRGLCEEAGVDPDSYEEVYPALKKSLTSWKPASMWELLDKRAKLSEYDSQTACRGRRVLVIGAGPVGLRMAVEAALLGARVDLVEKRDAFSRNNSLHLWSFLITDLRNLGAKKFYGKFASGSLDHICIRILQGILLKVCLLVGVRVHIGVTFSSLLEPTSTSTGWKVSMQPPSCPVTAHEYDAILAADGKKKSLPGFQLKEFRAKLALAITANFVNSNTQHENSVPEISGVSYVYRQGFFDSLAEKHGIVLENIVYYKDETHYFVMTAKKPSLLNKGVLKQDYNDPKQLLSPSNIDLTALKQYTVEAAKFSTNGDLPLTFEKNHRGEDDVALFDFTSLFASENAARIVERKGHKILLCVAGDSLTEPFWPTGSGCARGFLGAWDAVWMLKRYCAGTSALELVEEREALFYLLPQTTPERLAKNHTGYTIDPKTRYLNLSELVPPGDVSYLYDTDNPAAKPVPTHQPSQPPLAQDPPHAVKESAPLRKAASVSSGFSSKKRSRSSEGLGAIAESTLATESAFPAEPVESIQKHDSREASPAKQSPGGLRKRIEMLEAKEKMEVPARKSSKAERKTKASESSQRERTTTSNSCGPLSGGERERTPESPKSKQRGSRKLFSGGKREKTPESPKSELRGSQKLLSEGERERKPESPKSKHRGSRKLFSGGKREETPESPKSELRGSQKLLSGGEREKTPESPKSELRGSQKLLSRGEREKTPESPKSKQRGSRKLFSGGKREKTPESPKSELRGSQKLLSRGEREKTPESPKSRPRGLLRLFDQSKSKSKSSTSDIKDEMKKAESPTERSKGDKQTHLPVHEPSTHALKQAQPSTPHSGSPKERSISETQQAEKGHQHTPESVADIVKRLDTQETSTGNITGKKKEKKTKKGEKVKEKEKQHSKERAGQQKESETKSSRLLSFFRSKKSYDVAKTSSAAASSPTATHHSSSPELKKSKKSEREHVQSLSKQVSVQDRIRRLKELGVGDTDSPDMSLEQLRALEISSGILVEEEKAVEEIRSRSASPGYSDEGVESETSHSISPVYSDVDEPRSQSRTSHTSAGLASSAAEEDGHEVLSDVEEMDPGDEDVQPEQHSVSVVETVRQLEPLFASPVEPVLSRRQAANAKETRSKEFELAELHTQSKMDSSNPLWLARVIQGMGKCLERLRKDQNDILVTKTTLQIINTIVSNVQLHPGDDTYRRVRVSSQRFNQKVWQFNDAGQFLARAGWVEIGDYIVLPMGQTLDIAKRVLEKHLNIVNQMLWSQQLELPDSPGVLKKLQERGLTVTRRNRTITAAMIAHRQSYSSQLVDETLQRVEKEQEAMEAVLVHMSENGDKESSPDHFNISSVSEEREEEVRTMRAASAARSKWLERQKKEAVEQRGEREYKLILESELYDLPQPSLLVAAAAPVKSSSPVPAVSPSQVLPAPPVPLSTSPPTASPIQLESPSHVSCEGLVGEADEVCPHSDEDEKDAQMNGKEDGQKESAVMESTSTGCESTSQPNQLQTADAQCSTADSIRQDMMKYEKITLEAAAQVRQKWKDA